MADAPEAPAEQVQLPASNPRAEAIAAAQADLDAGPEAPVEGTAPASDSESLTVEDTPAPEPEPTDDRITREEADRLLARQKASFNSELQAARSQQEKANLLAHLDALRESDPDEWATVVDKNPSASAALAERASMLQPELIARARVEVTTDQARMLLEARPDLVDLIENDQAAWMAANNPETGGIFGHIHRTAMEQGKSEGIEAFKKSPDYKKAIEEAERRGAHNALGGIESPPPQEEGDVVGAPVRHFDNPRQEAVAMAKRAFQSAGRPVSIDPSAVGTRRRSA